MTVMVKWTLNTLIGELEDRTRKKVSLRAISRDTGISYPAVHRISQNSSDRIDTQTLDRLLRYFNQNLGRSVTAADLLKYEEEIVD